MKYRIKPSVTDEMMDEDGFLAGTIALLRANTFGYESETPERGVTVHENDNIGGWDIPFAFLEEVDETTPADTSGKYRLKSSVTDAMMKRISLHGKVIEQIRAATFEIKDPDRTCYSTHDIKIVHETVDDWQLPMDYIEPAHSEQPPCPVEINTSIKYRLKSTVTEEMLEEYSLGGTIGEALRANTFKIKESGSATDPEKRCIRTVSRAKNVGGWGMPFSWVEPETTTLATTMKYRIKPHLTHEETEKKGRVGAASIFRRLKDGEWEIKDERENDHGVRVVTLVGSNEAKGSHVYWFPVEYLEPVDGSEAPAAPPQMYRLKPVITPDHLEKVRIVDPEHQYVLRTLQFAVKDEGHQGFNTAFGQPVPVITTTGSEFAQANGFVLPKAWIETV